MCYADGPVILMNYLLYVHTGFSKRSVNGQSIQRKKDVRVTRQHIEYGEQVKADLE